VTPGCARLHSTGGYGTYLGWSIRAGKGNEASLTGTPVRDLHPQLMGVMTFIFLAGGSGGALFSLLLGRPPLESPHAITAVAGLGLLAANGLLSTVMKNSPDLRTAHAFLGTGAWLLLEMASTTGVAGGAMRALTRDCRLDGRLRHARRSGRGPCAQNWGCHRCCVAVQFLLCNRFSAFISCIHLSLNPCRLRPTVASPFAPVLLLCRRSAHRKRQRSPQDGCVGGLNARQVAS